MTDTDNLFFDSATSLFEVLTTGEKGGATAVDAYLSMRREETLRVVAGTLEDNPLRQDAETASQAFIEAQSILSQITQALQANAENSANG